MMSDYERCRQERIKENIERMKKLGILDLSLKLKTCSKPTRKYNIASSSSSSLQKTPQRVSPMRHLGPVRRSSRLGNATPISYSEVSLSKKGLFETEGLLREGSKPEVYTEEQLKLLGWSNTSWTLFVDGYGKDGKRIYDQINGKTCHQCRQKTLGYRTQCSQCCKVQGQFCGDCLYMRYGENVLEALQNPDWVCPVCRGICNCSLCRNAKGWAPTGIMYKKITELGFKSVAHYLLQTATDSEKEGTKVPVSAKRSLAFSSLEATSMLMESADSKDNLKESVVLKVELKFKKDEMNEEHNGDRCENQGSLMPQPKDNCQHGENNIEGNVDAETEDNCHGKNNIEGNVDTETDDNFQHGVNDIDGNVDTETKEGSVKISADVITNEEDSVQYMENEHCNSITAKKNITASNGKIPIRYEMMIDSIGARLRAAKISADVVANKEDSVQNLENKHCDSSVAKKNTTASKRKAPSSSEPMPDSIGARLRARRRMCSH